ncbi:SpoIID/LytB domain-containing protein [Bacteriovorax sp. DB6_IX]|uniref:SpoIID/LytB domain-containing protein n=1 Tax=Bacteriovorax sp. DB6_IX TaxID=1353530 RepID=UPI00038A4E7E|nr:SpoIID/LytB domain-containing protein [Bacteriovorax sp. DB6_IX]EQC51885.1 stage II sporulation protein [Bacteriovorax sp. DB6_IX]
MKKFITLATLVLIKFNLLAADEFYHHYPSSSIPPNFKEAALAIPADKSAIRDISVLIYPHDLKNDWRHGKPDDTTKFSILSDSIKKLTDANGRELTFTNATLYKQKSTILVIKNDGAKAYLQPPIQFSVTEAVKIERFGNEDKSNSYVGSFKIGLNEKGLYLVNTVDIETYLLGVVPSESVSTWPIEALKAQALAARSYALYHLINSRNNGKDWDVDDTARYQVYTGVSHRKPSTDRAVKETDSEVITYNDKVIVAFFHAFSGGWTDKASVIFEMSTVPYCDVSREVFSNEELKDNLPQRNHWIVEWKKDWSKKDVLTKLKKHKDLKAKFSKFDETQPFEFSVLDRNPNYNSARTIQITQGDNSETMYFKKMRGALGWSNFNSYHYFIENETQDSVQFRGFGWGHHIGLSQWGAFMMSKYYNYNYRDIIKHYYHNTRILKTAPLTWGSAQPNNL